MRRTCAGLAMVILAVLNCAMCQDDLDRQRPCEHKNAINLPKDKKCIVPIKTAYTWVRAASTCELAGGTLYQAPDSLLDSRPELMGCLASMTDTMYSDMWINALGLWSPHFTWTNGSPVNQVEFCPTVAPSRNNSNIVTSVTLSVDYCVMTCHLVGANYTIYHNNTRRFQTNTTTLECYCQHLLDKPSMGEKCPTSSVDVKMIDRFYILQSRADSMIQITSPNVDSRTEMLCTTVDARTTADRYIKTEKCFNTQQFICDLGDESRCARTDCAATECLTFTLKQKCMLRVSLNYNWYSAKAYCQKRGGDLWNMLLLTDLDQVPKVASAKYWIGATNYAWRFDAYSDSLGGIPSRDYSRVKCGHMTREGTLGSGYFWQWSDTVCDQAKSFLCQFPKTTFSLEEINNEVTCPWPFLPTPPPTTGPSGYPGVTNAPVTNTPRADPVSSSSDDGDSFPVGAVIAAIIAGIILLTCLLLIFAYCSRRKWLAGRFKKVREHLTFIPYFADVSGADYESHAGMSSVSDHGSQVGLVKGSYQNGTSGYGMSTSYGEQSGAFSSKSLDRKHKDSMDRKLVESQHYLASGNSSLDERGFSSSYNTMPSRPRDFMTLQAQMDIKDDAELASLRASFRNRPEVALVTDNVDMNFTVNHAVSRSLSHAGSELSRSSLERTMEEITMPATEGGTGLNLPDRVAEEARLYSTLASNYHNM